MWKVLVLQVRSWLIAPLFRISLAFRLIAHRMCFLPKRNHEAQWAYRRGTGRFPWAMRPCYSLPLHFCYRNMMIWAKDDWICGWTNTWPRLLQWLQWEKHRQWSSRNAGRALKNPLMFGIGCVSWLGRVRKLPKRDGVQDFPRKLSVYSNFVIVSSLQRRVSAQIVNGVVFWTEDDSYKEQFPMDSAARRNPWEQGVNSLWKILLHWGHTP